MPERIGGLQDVAVGIVEVNGGIAACVGDRVGMIGQIMVEPNVLPVAPVVEINLLEAS